jgi:hypothetical protein
LRAGNEHVPLEKRITGLGSYLPAVAQDGGLTGGGFDKTYGAAQIFRLDGQSSGKQSAKQENQNTCHNPSFIQGVIAVTF